MKLLRRLKRLLGFGILTPKSLKAFVTELTTSDVTIVFDSIVLCTRSFASFELVLRLKIIFGYDLESSEETELIQYQVIRHDRNSYQEGIELQAGIVDLHELPTAIRNFNELKLF